MSLKVQDLTLLKLNQTTTIQLSLLLSRATKQPILCKLQDSDLRQEFQPRVEQYVPEHQQPWDKEITDLTRDSAF